MTRGQNKGYQGYLILFPALCKAMVVMTNSDNGSILADALIRGLSGFMLGLASVCFPIERHKSWTFSRWF
jgi:hypothetical protein